MSADPVCPECGAPLHASGTSTTDGQTLPKPGNKNIVLITALSVIVVGICSFGGYLAYEKFSHVAPKPVPVATTKPAKAVVEALKPALTIKTVYSDAEIKAGFAKAEQEQQQGNSTLAAQDLNLTKAKVAVNEFALALQQGDMSSAKAHLDDALKFNPKDSLAWYNMAALSARDGDAAAAIKYLQSAVANGFTRVDMLAKDPDFDKVRSNNDFQAFVKQMPQ
ncbi:tetratricopeptide repeat protein [Paludibacterium sp. THUN1379]|uniref:TPR end-of-group domain-containing protein n=1 Tax=Paludibacterium sp. THUN1379 TaxID=3112107 RepID=UPI0030CB9A92